MTRSQWVMTAVLWKRAYPRPPAHYPSRISIAQPRIISSTTSTSLVKNLRVSDDATSRVLRSALPAGHALFECQGVDAVGFAFGDGLLGGGERFVLLPRVPEDVGSGGEIAEGRLGLDRLVDVLQRVVPVLVRGERVRCLEAEDFDVRDRGD